MLLTPTVLSHTYNGSYILSAVLVYSFRQIIGQ